MVLIQILIATLIISLIAFVGALISLKGEWLNKTLLILVALSSGTLLGGAFLHLLPEAVEKLGADLNIFLFLLLGFCLFFMLEQFFNWRHQHDEIHAKKPFTYLVLVGDGIHNFIDGLVISASFIVGYQVGVVTALAVALHEIPQELGDFGVLVYGGFDRKRALIFNYLSALLVIIGGITGYLAYSVIKTSIVYLLPFAAGNFIYIATADLIPEIKHHVSTSRSIIHFVTFLVGIGIMLLARLLGG